MPTRRQNTAATLDTRDRAAGDPNPGKGSQVPAGSRWGSELPAFHPPAHGSRAPRAVTSDIFTLSGELSALQKVLMSLRLGSLNPLRSPDSSLPGSRPQELTRCPDPPLATRLAGISPGCGPLPFAQLHDLHFNHSIDVLLGEPLRTLGSRGLPPKARPAPQVLPRTPAAPPDGTFTERQPRAADLMNVLGSRPL